MLNEIPARTLALVLLAAFGALLLGVALLLDRSRLAPKPGFSVTIRAFLGGASMIFAAAGLLWLIQDMLFGRIRGLFLYMSVFCIIVFGVGWKELRKFFIDPK